MDFAVLLQRLEKLWCFIPLIELLAIFGSRRFKGHGGESLVNASARLSLDKDRYHLIKSVTLPTEDGTTQIDHMIVPGAACFL